ncbi:acyltransferase family protein [soil metagenome]
MGLAPTDNDATAASPQRTARPGHRPGLDAVRALAVSAAIAYHLDLLSGGFLGVEVFFVLSGFLVTALALAEVEGSGGLGLRAFWARRARRLLPALLLLVPVVGLGAVAVGWAPTRLRSLALDGAATLTWTANWRQAASQATYWSAGSPSPLRHAWSLSIEEQFYALWPLALVAAITVARRRGWSLRRTVAVVAGVGAAASGLGTVALARGGADVSVLYVGTHSRACAPLVGCVLACAWSGRGQLGLDLGREGRAAVAASGVAGLVVLGVMAATVEVSDPRLYRRGGFLVASLASAALVAAATSIRSVGPVLSWMGKRSYGLYLWSWPTQVLFTAARPEASRRTVVLATALLTAAAAELSWRLVEQRALGRSRPERGRRAAPRPRRVPVGLGWSAGALACVVVLVGVAHRSEPPPAQEAFSPAETAELAADPPPRRAGPGLRVMLTGDSVAFTAGLNKPTPDVMAGLGLASIDGRAILECGVLAGDGYEYPRPEDGEWFLPADGSCATDQRKGEATGLAAAPDVVLNVPGAWEGTDVRSPDGQVVPARSRQMADLLVDAMVARARTNHEAGSRTVIAAWSCPGRHAIETRRDPAFTRWFNRDVVARAAREGTAAGFDVTVLEPTREVCVDADPLGHATVAKDRALADEIHVTDKAGGVWVWQTWLAPALLASQPT